MLVNYDVETINAEKISYSVTLVPRLDYSITLLDGIIEIVEQKRIDLKNFNKELLINFEMNDEFLIKSIELERTMAFSLEILIQTKKIIKNISAITTIPKILPPVIPVIRTLSAQLFEILPVCSQKLSELSVHLGSIILDSASITKAKFDFSQSNRESSNLLDEVKLMVDSKINKQYPNLDFLKSYDA